MLLNNATKCSQDLDGRDQDRDLKKIQDPRTRLEKIFETKIKTR